MEKTENIQAMNDHVCPHSRSFMLDNWLRRLVQSPRRILTGQVKEGNRVMDAGCGPGFFTIELAKLVGRSGKVIAADLQKEMLEKVKKKAARKKMSDRIILHQCPADRIHLEQDSFLDFILAFYMIHETPSPRNFLKEMKRYLKPGGRLLAVEPRMHVTREKFAQLVKTAEEIGFSVLGYPSRMGGRGLLLTVPNPGKN